MLLNSLLLALPPTGTYKRVSDPHFVLELVTVSVFIGKVGFDIILTCVTCHLL